jgi:hypothetical protein
MNILIGVALIILWALVFAMIGATLEKYKTFQEPVEWALYGVAGGLAVSLIINYILI